MGNLPKVFCIILSGLASCFSCAQNLEYTWAKRGGGNANFETRSPSSYSRSEHVRDIKIDAQGNRYYLAVMGGDMADLDGISVPIYVQPRAGEDILLWSSDCGGNFRWSKSIGSDNFTDVTGLSIDGSGNVYISGKVIPRPSTSAGFVHFDSDVVITTSLTLNDPGPHNKSLFLIKYDSNGNFQWLQRPEEDNMDLNKVVFSRAFAHATDAGGTSHFLVRMSAGTHLNGAYTSTGNELAILKFDSTGSYLGHVPVGLWYPGVVRPYSVNMLYDAPRNRYLISANRDVSRNFADRMELDGQSLPARCVLISADGITGTTQWFIEDRSSEGVTSYGLLQDGSGNIYMTGGASGGDWNGVPHGFAGYTFTMHRAGSPNFELPGPFLIKLDPMGNLLWGTQPQHGTDGAASYDVALYNNEVAIATAHTNTTPWGGMTYTQSRPGRQPMVVRFDTATGATLGIHDIHGFSTANEATAIAVDQYGNYAVGGYFTDSLFLPSGNTPGINLLSRRAGGNTDFFYASLNRTDCNGVPLSERSINAIQTLNLYPNPSSGDMVRIGGLEDTATYTIHDMSGRMVSSGTIESDGTLHIDQLKAGSYLVTVESPTGRQTLKLLRE